LKLPSRLESVDHLRGLAILLVALANYLASVRLVPAWLKHAPDIGLTVVDLIAPLFIFAIGLTYGFSLRRRISRDGWGKAVKHFVRRFLVLAGLGTLIGAGEILLGLNPGGYNWGVLQAIGVAGLLTLPVIRLPVLPRVGAGLALLVGYQVLLDRYWLQAVLQSPHSGLPGALSWAAMLILATVLADLFFDPSQPHAAYVLVTTLAVVAGIGLSVWVPISKNRVSASYVLVSLGISSALFSLVHLFANHLHLRLPLLSAWGKNPLLLYLLHLLLLGFVALPAIPQWYSDAPLWLIVLQIAALIGGLSWVAWRLQARGTIFSL